MPGAVENAAEDMSLVVANLDRIRQAIPGVTIGVLHHPTKANDDVERGAGTLANALDTVMNVRDEDGVCTLSCKYTRDLEPFKPIDYEIKSVALPGSPIYLSAVVRSFNLDEAAQAREDAKTLESKILKHLQEYGDCSGKDIAAALQLRKEPVFEACKRLATAKKIRQAGRKDRPHWELVKGKSAVVLPFGASEL
jgi:hypothetical protein